MSITYSLVKVLVIVLCRLLTIVHLPGTVLISTSSIIPIIDANMSTGPVDTPVFVELANSHDHISHTVSYQKASDVAVSKDETSQQNQPEMNECLKRSSKVPLVFRRTYECDKDDKWLNEAVPVNDISFFHVLLTKTALIICINAVIFFLVRISSGIIKFLYNNLRRRRIYSQSAYLLSNSSLRSTSLDMSLFASSSKSNFSGLDSLSSNSISRMRTRRVSSQESGLDYTVSPLNSVARPPWQMTIAEVHREFSSESLARNSVYLLNFNTRQGEATQPRYLTRLQARQLNTSMTRHQSIQTHPPRYMTRLQARRLNASESSLNCNAGDPFTDLHLYRRQSHESLEFRSSNSHDPRRSRSCPTLSGRHYYN